METKLKRQQATARMASVAICIALIALAAYVAQACVRAAARVEEVEFYTALLKDWRGVLTVVLSAAWPVVVGVELLLLAAVLRAVGRGISSFDEKNVRILKWMAVILTVIALCSLLYGLLIGWPSNAYDGPGHFDFNRYLDLGGAVGLLVAGGIFCIALVFEYGVTLQTLSDETL